MPMFPSSARVRFIRPWLPLLGVLLAYACSRAGGGGSGGEGGGQAGDGAGGDQGSAGAEQGGQPGQAGGAAGEGGGVSETGGTTSTGGVPAQGGAGGRGGGAAGGTGTGGRPAVMNTAACQPPALRLVRVATASSPMALAQAQGDARMFVVERDGGIRILQNGQLSSTRFADFRSSVITQAITGSSERGLLNLALHPRFPADPRFYVFYTRRGNDPHSPGGGAAEGHIVIAEGRQASASAAMPSLRPLSIIPHPEDHHIGGFLAFGPDGYLYAGTGDGGGMDDLKVGQDPRRKLSKILRIDVDNPTVKPPGNLDLPGADPHTWAYGARNPYRGSFDRATGDLYFGDVGMLSYEEINWVPPGMSQLNFGWGFDRDALGPDPSTPGMEHSRQSGMEGLHPMPFWVHLPWEPFGYLPIHEYPHDGPGWAKQDAKAWEGAGWACSGRGCEAAVMGGYVYRGADATLFGRYFYGDYSRNFVKSFIVENGRATCHADHTSQLATAQTPIQGLNGFGEGADGTLYLHDLAGGNIYRIERRP